ncbi:MarR family transcriptional regulator [Ensifer sp. 2YAB10]|uniref:MarR family transcriptional regulator n=1 Tax=unclassified Ensifer TaxID=2633371 RepID=UPI000DE4C529
MSTKDKHGLGELLRYVGELVDQGAAERYAALQIDYRPRYTPVLRALSAGAETVTEITASSRLTQGAISQTVSLMLKDGILARHGLEDGRKAGLRLTGKGVALLKILEPHWETTFLAIRNIEDEIGYPILEVLQALGTALEREGFASRLEAASNCQCEEETNGR